MGKTVARSFKGKIRVANAKISRRFRFWKQLTPARGYINVYDHNVQKSSSLKPLGQSKPNFKKRERRFIYKKGLGHMAKIAATPTLTNTKTIFKRIINANKIQKMSKYLFGI